ncbi:hypothetical protein L1O03_02950 [Corynebacterium uropygiale]|uniref:Helix-turn-helix domain-containing protein n=1 Tax=Corynebacterium uropygiale TaxID=1775911 RepID=A0A9X1QNX6_9CORY|nr:hypothetical protein [Corynebacterium uropygiale]MCF4006136.1 hypothetical protein [Corynebacterium uropygiale]
MTTSNETVYTIQNPHQIPGRNMDPEAYQVTGTLFELQSWLVSQVGDPADYQWEALCAYYHTPAPTREQWEEYADYDTLRKTEAEPEDFEPMPEPVPLSIDHVVEMAAHMWDVPARHVKAFEGRIKATFPSEFQAIKLLTGLSTGELADRLNVGKPTVRHWLSGESPIPLSASKDIYELYIAEAPVDELEEAISTAEEFAYRMEDKYPW